MSGKDKIDSNLSKNIPVKKDLEQKPLQQEKISEQGQKRFEQALSQKEKNKGDVDKGFLGRMSEMFKHMLSKEASVERKEMVDERGGTDLDKDKREIKDTDHKGDRKEIDEKDIGKKKSDIVEEGSEVAKKEGDLKASDKVVVQQLGDTIIKGMVTFASEVRPSLATSERAEAIKAAMEVVSSMAVSKGEFGQDRMCQVTIGKESILSGTDIRIFEKGGDLQVQFFVKTDAAASLMQQQAVVQNLQNFLQVQLNQANINITVNDERGGQGGGGGQGGDQQGGGGQEQGGGGQQGSQQQDQSQSGPFSRQTE